MDKSTLLRLLTELSEGKCTVSDAAQKLEHFPSEILEHARIDHHRMLRTGIPEVIYGAAKTAEQIITIARSLLDQPVPVLATRVCADKAEQVIAALPQLTYAPLARMLTFRAASIESGKRRGKVLVICAGTSDIGVAEEAALTAECFGNPVCRLYDAGVAGLHRLLSQQQLLNEAAVLIVVAGMEGALPSVVAGLVASPVVAVPTSIGYGASFGGIAALLGMLNSCAPGVGVVNIDNGFGAACLADAINREQ